jgi:hypothetical protein
MPITNALRAHSAPARLFYFKKIKLKRKSGRRAVKKIKLKRKSGRRAVSSKRIRDRHRAHSAPARFFYFLKNKIKKKIWQARCEL